MTHNATAFYASTLKKIKNQFDAHIVLMHGTENHPLKH